MFHRSTNFPPKANGERDDRASNPRIHTSNALDRCDRCGAQAYVRATLATGGELMFCAHHGKEYAEKLKTVAVAIQDESERLVESKN